MRNVRSYCYPTKIKYDNLDIRILNYQSEVRMNKLTILNAKILRIYIFLVMVLINFWLLPDERVNTVVKWSAQIPVGTAF
jgi:hypothetical protein